MKKILNKRLLTLSAFINDKETVLDIGCDHGFLGIYLTLNKKKVKVISSDINEKPLNKAKENIHTFNLDKKIETRLGDGLEVISSDVVTVVISGMGTENIIKILSTINNYPNVKKLVLSPNNDFILLRKEISKLGFTITKEEIVKEKGKYYLISEFLKGNDKINYYFGKLDLTNDTVIDYYKYVYDNNKKILNKLSLINKIKKLSLIKENYLIKKVVLK